MDEVLSLIKNVFSIHVHTKQIYTRSLQGGAYLNVIIITIVNKRQAIDIPHPM